MKNTKKTLPVHDNDTFGNAFIKLCESLGIKFIDEPKGQKKASKKA